jgi:hypothetical protein
MNSTAIQWYGHCIFILNYEVYSYFGAFRVRNPSYSRT